MSARKTNAKGRAPRGEEHLPAEFFASVAEGDEESREARLHLERCRACSRRRQAALALREARLGGELEPVPQVARRRAELLFDRWRAERTAPRPSALAVAWGRLRVLLAPDFGTGLTAAGVALRGGATTVRCRLAGGEHQLDLEWMPRSRSWSLRGRVTVQGESAGRGGRLRLVLEPKGGEPIEVRPNGRGFFGPVRMSDPGVRLTLVSDRRSYRSTWLPGGKSKR
jgi:hypothetical protein